MAYSNASDAPHTAGAPSAALGFYLPVQIYSPASAATLGDYLFDVAYRPTLGLRQMLASNSSAGVSEVPTFFRALSACLFRQSLVGEQGRNWPILS